MILISALLLSVAQQTGQSIVPLGTYEINQSVQPYFHRYTECIETYVRERAVQPASTDALRELYDAAVPACAEVRRREYEGAERALRHSPQFGNADDRQRILEETFHSADRVRNQYGAAVRREMHEQQAMDARPDGEIVAAKESRGPPPLESDRPLGHLNIPDEIAPAIASQATPPPDQGAELPPIRRAVPTARLVIPDEIAAAVVPYMRCLDASRGMEVRSQGRVLPPPPGISLGSDCSRHRAIAARQADDMLQAQHRGRRSERGAFIERTLTSIDNFVGASSQPRPSRSE